MAKLGRIFCCSWLLLLQLFINTSQGLKHITNTKYWKSWKNDICNLYHYLHKSGYQGSVPANNDYISNQAIWVNPEEEEVNCSKAGEQSSWQINIIREAFYITLHWTEKRGKPDLQPKDRIVAWCKSSSTACWTTCYHCLLYKVHK